MTHGAFENAILLAAQAGPSQIIYEFYSQLPGYYPGYSGEQKLFTFDGTAYQDYEWPVGQFGALTTSQANFVRNFYSEKIESVINVTSTEVSSQSPASVGYGFINPGTVLYSKSSSGVYTPLQGFVPVHIDSNDVWFTPAAIAGAGDWETLAHETGHTLGLLDSEAILTGSDDTHQFTMMSYAKHPDISAAASTTDLQLYDIAALQYLYGPTTLNSGNTTYQNFIDGGANRYFSIWDAGGTDVIKAGDSTDAVLIDLRPGYFSSLGSSTRVSHDGTDILNWGIQNISIAFGAFFENAEGGSEDDVLIGNMFSNTLRGGDGNDLIYAEGAVVNDAENGDGHYVVVEKDGWDDVLLDPDAQRDTLYGGDGNDSLFGGRGNDVLYSGAGHDILNGGAGAESCIPTPSARPC